MIDFTSLAYAVVLGTALGLGVCLVVSRAPRWGAPSLSRRLAPYVRDVTDPRGIAPVATPVVGADAVWLRLRDHVARLVGGDDALARRLRRAGRAPDVSVFRGQQLVWALGGAGAGAAGAVALTLAGRGGVATWLLAGVGGVAGFLACDMLLSRAARMRAARIEEELPTILEFLALCLSAGEGILDSLRRVSAMGTGDFTRELRATVLAVGTGSPLSTSLTEMSTNLDVPAVSRSVDHLVSAIDRGAPLAQVLHAQALDAREEAKRSLIERAGKNEIYMLIPLVLVILPLSVLFAVFPGIFMLRLGVG
ncbi:type II secretion system F family protein [Microbacterium sp. C7(2022)]|uniref:type II secretion system F family protein n=1 Tax=Microbacterium sp. C7(2022) TaxID=2992759 RepID=UPI00237C05A2|nr:type II secretion system F family protein [Microbacterium sp. C7(2022)]MDE0545651.1 type II secretion system F family protein [Microbacterium sp. C7(2022)]